MSMRRESWTFEKQTTPTYHSNPFFQTWTFENYPNLSLSLPDNQLMPVTVSHPCKKRDSNARQSDRDKKFDTKSTSSCQTLVNFNSCLNIKLLILRITKAQLTEAWFKVRFAIVPYHTIWNAYWTAEINSTLKSLKSSNLSEMHSLAIFSSQLKY